MSIAICDPDAFYPLRQLVSGPFYDLAELPAIERIVRAVALHDETAMQFVPLPYDPEAELPFTEEEQEAGRRNIITAVAPVLVGYDFFTDAYDLEIPEDMEIAPALAEIASQHANAGEGNPYFDAHMDYLRRAIGIVRRGGSLLLCSDFGQHVQATSELRPELLFRHLDEDWRVFAAQGEADGFGLLVPPVLGIVLSRCARRDAIPYVIRDLRDEWAGARRNVWRMLDALRSCGTVGEAIEIRRELSAASQLFSPKQSDTDTRPIRVFWDIVSGGISGVAGAVAQTARSLPALAGFGPMLFGKGAFDFAKKVRRAAGQVQLNALPRLLTDAEKRNLGMTC